MDPQHGFDIAPYIQFGSFGVLAGLIWHIVKVLIPRQEAMAAAREARAEARDASFLAAIEKQHADCTEQLDAQRRELLESIAHARANYRQENALIRESYERSLDRIGAARSPKAGSNGGA